MIDPAVVSIAQEFIEAWSDKFKNYPRYALDLSWPSIGIVDKILIPLRYNQDFNELEHNTIVGAAAYIGGIIGGIWSNFPDRTIEASIALSKESDKTEIILSAKGGRFLPRRQRYTIELVSSLKKILSNPLSPFPAFNFYSQPISPYDNIVSLFARGVACGCSPFGVGPWNDIPLKDMDPYLISMQTTIARQCATYYDKAFPSERIGRQAILYWHYLILPPLGFNEIFMGATMANGLNMFVQNNQYDKNDLIQLGINLAQTPDDMLSAAGFILASGLLTESPSDKYRAARETMGNRAIDLKPAIHFFKLKTEGPKSTWLDSIYLQEKDTTLARLQIEREQNLLPMLRLSNQTLTSISSYPIACALCFSQANVARSLINFLAKKGRISIDYILQGIFLDILQYNLRNASKDIQEIVDIPISNPYTQSVRDEALGILAFYDKQYDKAITHLMATLPIAVEDLSRYTDIVNYIICSHIACKKYEEALELTKTLLKRNPSSILSLLNQSFLLSVLKNNRDLNQELEHIARIAPMDNRVFMKVMT